MTDQEEIHIKCSSDPKERMEAAKALGTDFQHMSDKQQAWEDLHRLTFDEDNDVKRVAVRALGTAFQHVLDKQQAWEDLHQLTFDEDNYVRRRAVKALVSKPFNFCSSLYAF